MPTEDEGKEKKKFRLNMSHLQGFIAGVLITAVVAVGLYVAVDDPDFISGTVSEPGKDPTTYYMYPKDSTVDRDTGKNFGDCTSEIILTGFDFGGYRPAEYGYYSSGMEKYWNCNGATLNGDEFASLFSLMGLTYGGEGKNFKLPNLSLSDKNGNPVTYQICHKGEAPSQTGAPGTVVGDIKYFAHEGLPSNNYLGEIFLIKNLDEGKNPHLMPCKGQLMPLRQYTALFSLLGTRFGGDGRVTFAVPDLSNAKPPVEGAEYYMLNGGGNFPHRN